MYNPHISHGKRITQATNLNTFTLEKIIDAIKTHPKLKEHSEWLRNEPDKDKRKKYKAANLSYVLFAGRFEKRSMDGLIESSGLMCIDIDEYDSNKSKELFEFLKLNPYVYIMFASPSGGLKPAIKIPRINSDNEYKQFYYGFVNKYPELDIDIQGADICRACYLSYDPELYINKYAKLFEHKSKKIEKRNIQNVVKKSTKRVGRDRSAYDFAFCCNLIRKGKEKQDVFNILEKSGSDRWKSETQRYKELTYNNAMISVRGR